MHMRHTLFLVEICFASLVLVAGSVGCTKQENTKTSDTPSTQAQTQPPPAPPAPSANSVAAESAKSPADAVADSLPEPAPKTDETVVNKESQAISSTPPTPQPELVILATPLAGWADLPSAAQAGQMIFGGQPNEAVLSKFADQGGTTVINLRTMGGFDKPSFDEQAFAKSLGLRYVHLPIAGASMTSDDVQTLAKTLANADGQVMIHCASSNRVGALWAAYLATERNVDLETAIKAGKTAGMKNPALEKAVRILLGG